MKLMSIRCGLTALTFTVSGANAQTFSVIARIPGGPQIGAIKGTTLYGTIAYSNPPTLFSLTTTGTYTLLHNFNPAVDGSAPNASLAIDSAGDIYGTAAGGGVNNAGTIWKYSVAGVFTTPHAFGSGSDGAVPFQGPTIGPRGVIYGAAGEGTPNNNGNIFSMSRSGDYTLIYNFLSGTDGHCPFSGVAVSGSGIVYGTTVGDGGGGNPTGSIWQYTAGGGLKTLYVFTDGNDGEYPDQTPTIDKHGNIYGTTRFKAGASAAGTIWKLTAAGKFTVLHEMNAATDGFGPNSPLVLNTNGVLYGTTGSGGVNNYGTVFSITKTGKFAVIHSFTAGSDGAEPSGNLVHDATGHIFGGTDYGPVFEITP